MICAGRPLYEKEGINTELTCDTLKGYTYKGDRDTCIYLRFMPNTTHLQDSSAGLRWGYIIRTMQVYL